MTIPGGLLDLINATPNYGGMNTPMPAPQAAALPPSPAGPPSLWDRVQRSLMPVPAGLDGLLTDEDVKHARRMGLLNFGLSMLDQAHGAPGQNAPSVGQAFARSVHGGIDSYNQNIQNTAQQGVAGQELAQKRLIMMNRQRVAQQFAPQPNETSDQTVQRLKSMYLEYLRAGDTEMAGKLGEVVSKLFSGGEHPVEHVDLGDHTEIIDPISGQDAALSPERHQAEDRSRSRRGQPVPGGPEEQDPRRLRSRHRRLPRKVMGGWDVLMGATKNPSLATPFAVTDAYARITNPGAIVRPTTMEMIKEMGSVGQRMQKYWEQNVNGSLPADILNDFKRTLYNIVKEHKNQYDKIRRAALTRGQQLGINDLAPLLQDYQLDRSARDAAAA
jgi:hypothetical protein